MKILHTSDLHFHQKTYEKILKIEKDYDLIIISGDLIESNKNNIKKQIDWLIDWSHSISTPLLISSGNHDFDYNEAQWMQKLNGICDREMEIENLKILALPYIGGDFSNLWGIDILVYHIPPANTLTSTTIDGKAPPFINKVFPSSNFAIHTQPKPILSIFTFSIIFVLVLFHIKNLYKVN